MFPFDKEKGIRKPSLFGGFDEFFADFEEQTTRLFEQADRAGGKSFIYGYRAYSGPDGKPVVEEYSNVPGFKGLAGGEFAKALPASSAPQSCAAPETGGEAVEPYYDVLDQGDKVKLIVEMPCVEKKDIKLKSTGRTITVEAKGSYRDYATKIRVPENVESKPERAEYNNGVLEVTYAKAQTEDINVA